MTGRLADYNGRTAQKTNLTWKERGLLKQQKFLLQIFDISIRLRSFQTSLVSTYRAGYTFWGNTKLPCHFKLWLNSKRYRAPRAGDSHRAAQWVQWTQILNFVRQPRAVFIHAKFPDESFSQHPGLWIKLTFSRVHFTNKPEHKKVNLTLFWQYWN